MIRKRPWECIKKIGAVWAVPVIILQLYKDAHYAGEKKSIIQFLTSLSTATVQKPCRPTCRPTHEFVNFCDQQQTQIFFLNVTLRILVCFWPLTHWFRLTFSQKSVSSIYKRALAKLLPINMWEINDWNWRLVNILRKKLACAVKGQIMAAAILVC